MKKLIYVITPVLLAMSFGACSSDDDNGVEIPASSEMKVLEYRPAPGQFINQGTNFNTMAEANAWAEERFKANEYVSLGSFGGYITVKTPEPIKNRKGYDFGIVGNPFDGSSEPGIVWVSEDTNNNGLADDEWYELKGSDNTQKGYQVIYYRPEEPGDIKWTDNKGNEGVINYIPQYHEQMYYPQWIKENSYTLTGSMLQPRTIQQGGNWINQNFGWGFADNMGSDVANNSSGNYRYNQFELDNAIDADGNPVEIVQIHFIKVQSAILKNAGVIGEVSTEVLGFKIF